MRPRGIAARMRRFAVLIVFALGGSSAWALDPLSNEALTQRVLKKRIQQMELFKMPFQLTLGKGARQKAPLSLFTPDKPSPIKTPHLFMATESGKPCVARPLDTKIDPRSALRVSKAASVKALAVPAAEDQAGCTK